MEVYPFPDDNIRAAIHNIIHLNALGKISRVYMDDAISRFLTSYGVTKIHMDGYTVRLTEPIVTPMGKFPVTQVIAHRKSEGQDCPICGGKPGYLDGDMVVTAACRDCGCVFKFTKEYDCAPSGAKEASYGFKRHPRKTP